MNNDRSISPSSKGDSTAPQPSDTQNDRSAEAVGEEHPPVLDFAVIGVGASAGGLEAFIDFLSAMPADSNAAVVFIQHLPPDRESMVAEILSRKTGLRVVQIEDGMGVEPNTVYVIRPGNTLTLKDGRLRLAESTARRGHGRPVDDFFKSLAAEQQERAICVVLSGMGSNGAAGCQAIKAVGGFCIAQDPESAKFPSMPRHLIDTGYADAILRPSEMPGAALQYARHPYAQREAPPTFVGLGQEYAEAMAILKARTRRDLTGYKKPTVLRRMQRRMGLLQIETLAEYVRTLRQNPSEVATLADDVMIHVTGFFRDGDAWKTLSDKVIRPLVLERDADMPLRCWVTACSSGEEAYTLAMLLVEACEAANKRLDIKIFATDTADRTLGHARQGVYPGGIESDISAERLAQFFDKDDSNYRVKARLREMIVFAPQNVLQDPPFSKIDICSCRNLLIYLEPDMQRRVLSMLHFGLREGGALFLGSSETVAGSDDMFELVDKKARIFRRVGPSRHNHFDFPPLPGSVRGVGERGDAMAFVRPSIAMQTNRVLLEGYTPAAVTVDRSGRVQYFHGATERYLQQPSGEPTRELLTLAREGLRGALRTVLHQSQSERRRAAAECTVRGPEGPTRVQVTAAPLDAEDTSCDHLLVTFAEREASSPSSPDADDASQDLVRDELIRVRDELQTTVEELQTSNEEMRASHEEITSINEELQSANEELETSKEELQSLNEELTTVNAQLQAKMEELESTSNDLASLLSSTDIAVIFLDARFRIRRYTPAVRDLFDLIPGDVGRPISDLARKFADPDMLNHAREALDRLATMTAEVQSESGRWYMRRALPYRTLDNRIGGVVLTFVDITERQLAARERDALLAREQQSRQEAERTARAKDDFLNTLSHELRTPLSTITIWANLLRDGDHDAARIEEGVAAIGASALAQKRLIDDLLDTARISSGKFRLDLRETDVREAVEAAVTELKPEAHGRQQDLRVEIDDGLGHAIADGDRIRQIVANLLGNAIKFTNERGTILVRAARDGDTVEIEVRDNGRGIHPSFLPHLFDRFSQADTSTTRRVGGLGLGLSICKQIVEMHSGEIEARSEGPNRGAAFVVRLPLPRIEPGSLGAPEDHTRRLPSGLLRGATGLVIEDDKETLNAMLALLSRLGAHAVPAFTGEAALSAMNDTRFDFLVCDIGLPDMEGHEFIKRARERERERGVGRTPAIALTAYAREQDHVDAMASGFDAYLPKPAHPFRIATILHGLLRREA